MSEKLTDHEVHKYLELISEQGCEVVNQLLVAVENGEGIPQISHLNIEQQKQVVDELKKVMAVYTQCDIR